MNLTDFKGDRTKPLGVSTFFRAEKGVLTIFRLDAGAVTHEHKSHVPARLVLLRGAAAFEEIGGPITELSEVLDYVDILPEVLHKVIARSDAYLMLVQ